MSDLFDKTTSALGASLNLRHVKHNLISSNIANAETPGYHAKKLDFEDALARALDTDGVRGMSTSDDAHFAVGGGSVSKVKPDIYENPDGVVNNDGNTVDLEKEMSNLAENATLYRAAIQLINKKLAAMKYAATDGGR